MCNVTGRATAVFLCGALHDSCIETAVIPLINDGQYTNFDTPLGWHIELGVFTSNKTVVRCPEHCRFIGKSLAAGGYWRDEE